MKIKPDIILENGAEIYFTPSGYNYLYDKFIEGKRMTKQDKYTKSANGAMCQIRIPGYCNHNPETTVLCHLNGGGMATKHDSRHGAFGCNVCHDIVDGRKTITEFTYDEIKLMHLEGMVRTQQIWINEDLM